MMKRFILYIYTIILLFIAGAAAPLYRHYNDVMRELNDYRNLDAWSHEADSPFAGGDVVFDGRHKMHDMVVVKWVTADNVRSECSKYITSKYEVNACAVWSEATNSCLIITRNYPTMADLGHELRHCFQGSWHKDADAAIHNKRG